MILFIFTFYLNQLKKGGQMRHKRLKLSAIFLLGLGLTGLQAQEPIPATGGNASGSYSVGQVVYTTNTGDQDLSGLATTTAVTTGLALKVDKVTGKGLSTNDYTTVEKTKLSGLNNADGSETKVIAGTNVTGSGTTVSPYVANATGATVLAIGQSYQGGIIFWLDTTGQYGLIAAPADQSTGIQWYNGTYTVTNAVRDGIGAGRFNTARIIANQGQGGVAYSYAAQICANYQGGNYFDWYLPSKYELNLLYLQKSVVGGFAGHSYWSSSEVNSNLASNQNFRHGYTNHNGKYGTDYVRAIRAF